MRLEHLAKSWVTGFLTVAVLLVAAPPSFGAIRQATSLIEAAKRGDLKVVRASLQQGVDVNALGADGSTALHWAVYNDDATAVDVLLRAGANARIENRYGVTPLWLASINGNTAIVERLLTAGADANAVRPDNGETPLMIAARAGHTEIIRLLLARGAKVNAAESLRGQTPLMWAAAEQHPAAVKALLEAGADLKARSKTKMTPLMFAIRAGDVESTRHLLDAGADLKETAEDGTSMLVLAILNARFELAAYLLDRGADPNIDDPHGPPLFVLTWLRSAINRSLTKILVRTPTGSMDSFDLGKALLAHGANINARVDWKDIGESYGGAAGGRARTPNHLAIGPYFLSFVGATPLYVAAMNCDVPYMRFLAANGADGTIPTRQNVTPLLIASGIGFYEGEHPGDPQVCLDAVKLAYELGNDPKAVVTYNGYNIGSVNWDGATALHGAATRGANAMAEWLVKQGVPLDKTTKQGMTAWDIADGSNITGVFHQWVETAALLRKMMEERGLPVVVSPARSARTY